MIYAGDRHRYAGVLESRSLPTSKWGYTSDRLLLDRQSRGDPRLLHEKYTR